MKLTWLTKGLRQISIVTFIFYLLIEIDLTYEGIATINLFFLFNIAFFNIEIDLTYEGIATHGQHGDELFSCFRLKLTWLTKGLRLNPAFKSILFFNLNIEIDLTYEGIATNTFLWADPIVLVDIEIDLTYEGIATRWSNPVFHATKASHWNWPDLRRDCDKGILLAIKTLSALKLKLTWLTKGLRRIEPGFVD